MEHLLDWLNEQRGRRGRLAEVLSITPGALSQWTQVPANRVIEVEHATGISRHALRPDVFGPVIPATRRPSKLEKTA